MKHHNTDEAPNQAARGGQHTIATERHAFECAEGVAEFVEVIRSLQGARDIMVYTGNTVARLLPRAIITVSSLSADENTARVVYHSMSAEIRDLVKARFNADPIKFLWRLDGIPAGDREFFLTSTKITAVEGGLHALLLGRIPHEICREVEQTLDLRHVYWINFTLNAPFGGLAVLSPEKLTPGQCQTISTLVSLASFVCRKKLAESALLEAEKKFRGVFDNAREGIFMSRPEGGYVDVNPATARMFRYDTPAEFMAAHADIASVYVNPVMRERFIEKMEKDGHIEDFQYQAYRRDGSTIWVSENAHSVYNDDGSLKYYEGTLLDITVQKSTIEQVLRINEEVSCLNRISEIALSSVDPGAVFPAIAGAITQAMHFSHVGIEIYHPRSGVMEMKALTATKGRTLRCPFDIPVEETPSSRVVLTGRPLWFEDVRESGLLTNPLLLSLDPRAYICVPLRSANVVVGTLTCIDPASMPITSEIKDFAQSLANHVAAITERIRSELALRKSELEFRCITTAANDAIIMINPRGRIEYWNKAAQTIFGYNEREALGRDANSLLAPGEYQDAYMRALEDFRRSGRETMVGEPMEVHARRKDGSELVVELSVGALKHQKDWQAVAIIRDISRRKTVEHELLVAKEKAEESDRLKSMLLNNMSHELRTPMNGILGFASLLCEELRDPFNREMANNIHDSGERLMRTLDSIIDLSVLQSDTVRSTLLSVAVDPVIARAIEPYTRTCESKGLYLKTHSPVALCAVCDERLLSRLLDYLLDNAVKYTDQGGIRITTEIDRDAGSNWVVIRISDTGIGISEEKREIIFKEFRQESEGYGRAYEGSGIGLTLGKKLVEAMHGRISVTSRKGEGSTFSVHLPLAIEHHEGEEPAATPRTGDETVGDAAVGAELPTVLLVEDNRINVDLVITFLAGWYHVDFATDALGAIEAAKRGIYDAILMDIHLGAGMDGLEAARRIRALPGCETIPIIALTGYALSLDEQRILAGGCTHYLPKPFTRTELVAILGKALKTVNGEQ